MTDSTRIALTALLWSRCARGLVASADIAACASVLPNGRQTDSVTLAHDLVVAGLLVRAPENLMSRAWTLSPRAVEELSLPDRSDLSLSPEEEQQLFTALQQSASNGQIERGDLHAVTRRFLEDVLEGALIPDELLENIVAACSAHGHLTMTDDGGKYTIIV